jgi:hypothetical protein
MALGLALAAFVWIPGLTMNQLVQVDALMQGATRYSNHFVYLHQLIDSPWGYGFSLPGDQDGMSFSLGWSHVLIAIAAVLTIVKSNKVWVWFFAGATAILCVLMLQDAEPVWDQIPVLQYVAFPWRLLGPIAIVLAALIAALGARTAQWDRWRSVAFTFAMILLIVPNLAHFQPRQFRDIDMRFWSPQEIAERGIEVTSFAEYRPREMDQVPPFDPRPAEIVAGNAEIQQTSKSPASWTGVIQANTTATAELRLAYFPAWTVFVDGKPVAARASEKTGLIRFDVPTGEHRVAVRWTRPTSLWIADLVSLLALCVLILAAILSSASGRGRYARGSVAAPRREQ